MQDHLSTTFAALADPTRRAILGRLMQGETSVSELAEPFAMTMPAVSKHLKVLERAGLIARGREAQWRPCRLNASPLKEAANWIEDYRRFWGRHIDALERHLDRMKLAESASKTPGVKRAKKTRAGAFKARAPKPRKGRSR
ncbi:ArsR/SmtB family transcription factor [Occallatibacter savannae]|uniref:ArsR/SmtB family transcription factor n=1 Tax=Occallatibacter savannae TaxID=1002691 RepID=UPI000D685596|nr:metalloregulator ArsR/SmtB family transcription factor [Occallatibacter savannae]